MIVVAFFLLGGNDAYQRLQFKERTGEGHRSLDRAVMISLPIRGSPDRFPKPQWMIEPSSLAVGEGHVQRVPWTLDSGLVS